MSTKNKDYKDYTNEELDEYRHSFVKATLRRASYRWPWRNLIAARSRISRGLYECKACKQVVRNKDKKIDHINPVVHPERGFEGWDIFTERLFSGLDNFQVLCNVCHKEKTDKENNERKAIRAKVRQKKDSK